MTGALIILGVLVLVGVVLYAGELRYRRRMAEKAAEGGGEDAGQEPDGEGNTDAAAADSQQCCGQHLVCEKDLLTPMSDEILYDDDEELDRFIGRDPHSYTPEETEEFRDVLMTLRPEDVAGWARSITQRRLELPADVRDELLMLVNERREAARL